MITVAELKQAVNGETGGLLPPDAQEFRRSQAERHALPDFEKLYLMEDDILVLRTKKVDLAKYRRKSGKVAKCAIM